MITPINSVLLAYVFLTSDYTMFKKLDSNRIVTDGRVKKLLSSFGEKVIDIPIIVNEFYQIIDGQGRFEARKQLGLPIPFIIINDLNLDDCIRLNRYNTKWTINDWVDSWANNKDHNISSNYIRLKNCANSNNISFSRAINLSLHSWIKTENMTEGKLVFTDDDVTAVNDVVEKGNEIITALCFTQRTNEAFWSSVKVAIRTDGYNHARMIRNCTSCRATYHQMANMEAQLKEFSRIYNYRTTKVASKLYFEDYMRNKGYNIRSYSERKSSDRVDVSTLE